MINKRIVKKITIVIFLTFFTINIVVAEQLQDLSIVITSCDKYSGLWKPFFTLLFKNWPSLNKGGKYQDIPIFLITNTQTFDHLRVKNITFPNEISWSDDMLKTLAQVKTKYVLYLQDDYFLTEPVNETLLEQMLAYVKKHDAAYVQIACLSIKENAQTMKQQIPIQGSPNLAEFAKHSRYRTSLQAAIWEKDAFAWLLNPEESIWNFETLGSKRSEGMTKLFLGHLNTDNDPIKYLNAVNNGLLSKEVVDYLHQQNIAFDPKLQQIPLDENSKFLIFRRKVKVFLLGEHRMAQIKKILSKIEKILG